MYLLMTYLFFSIDATRMLNADGLYTMVIGGFGMVAPVQGGLGHIIHCKNWANDSYFLRFCLVICTVVHTAQTLMTLSVGGISVQWYF